MDRPVIHKHDNIEELVWLFGNSYECLQYLISQDNEAIFDHVLQEVDGENKIISLKSFFNTQANEKIRCQFKSIPRNSIKEIKGCPELNNRNSKIRIGKYGNEYCFILQSMSDYFRIKNCVKNQCRLRKVCPYAIYNTIVLNLCLFLKQK